MNSVLGLVNLRYLWKIYIIENSWKNYFQLESSWKASQKSTKRSEGKPHGYLRRKCSRQGELQMSKTCSRTCFGEFIEHNKRAVEFCSNMITRQSFADRMCMLFF